MKFKKFQAATLAEAVAQVKSELGPDALIISTKDVGRGLRAKVEVTAALEHDEHGRPEAKRVAEKKPGEESGGRGNQVSSSLGVSPPAAAADAGRLTNEDIEKFVAPLRSELRTLRTMLRAEADPAASELRRELALLRDQVARLPGAGATASGQVELLRHLASRSDIATLERSRITALVGPTGVGKTTTIAKLAARSALMEGERVAIVSLDGYRVGGEEQMRIFADLIGVPLYMARSPAEARSVILSLSEHERIFVDTAGRSPKDTVAISDTILTLLDLPDVEIHLAIALGMGAATIDRWMGLYPEDAIDRLLFTKVDEAEDLGELVRTPVRLKRKVRYITNGQRVPEDLEDATKERLLYLATEGLVSGAADKKSGTGREAA